LSGEQLDAQYRDHAARATDLWADTAYRAAMAEFAPGVGEAADVADGATAGALLGTVVGTTGRPR
ncbi:MAG: hypothetical protein KY463_09570, partial [Actinobacteria bacterium]|nr:hypothetical protein [Actinomycetota bacterium]